jgi:hypothetical protein
MTMMFDGTRKLIQAGNQKQPSLHVILPAFWIRYHDLHKGDLIKWLATDKFIMIMKNDDHAKEVTELMKKQEAEKQGGN